MDRQFPRRAARCFIAAVLLLAAGASQAVRIRDLIDDPRTYVDRTVTIDGEVVGMLSLFVVKYFTVNDGTASINVFTAKPLPRKGQRIRVTGKVEEMFSFGSRTLLILTEENKGEARPGTQRTVVPELREKIHAGVR